MPHLKGLTTKPSSLLIYDSEIELHLQQTTSFCLKAIRFVTTRKSESFELGCDATTGRQILPIPVNQLTNQVSLELKYSGTLFLSEVSWKTGQLSTKVTTMQLLRRCTSSPYTMVSLTSSWKFEASTVSLTELPASIENAHCIFHA